MLIHTPATFSRRPATEAGRIMFRMKRSALCFILLTCGMLALRGAAWAQDQFPSRAITIAVGSPPGGGLDTTARAMAPELSARMGQPVIIENRTGAAGMVALLYVARAKPDGYNLA